GELDAVKPEVAIEPRSPAPRPGGLAENAPAGRLPVAFPDLDPTPPAGRDKAEIEREAPIVHFDAGDLSPRQEDLAGTGPFAAQIAADVGFDRAFDPAGQAGPRRQKPRHLNPV